MKKTLALVLALAMVFSTFTVVFAEDVLSEDAQICVNLGMLKGESGTVDAAYVATAPTRMQAAIMFLRLKGLEAEALAYTGEDNFADGKLAWAEGANLLAYLKANPQLGWQGDGTNFDPNGKITAQMYYKVLLEALGYKQSTAEVVGDFEWANVLEFAAGKGLAKVAAVAEFTVNDLAVATVEALKVNVKGTEAALYKSLVAEEAAAAAGLVEAAPKTISAKVDEVTTLGSAVVQILFEEDIDEAAENIDNYSIDGLAINAVTVSASNAVRLDTAVMASGKLYKLTVGEEVIQFAGTGKVSGGPEIDKVESEDVEEVVITFDKNVDFATATNPGNYVISGVEVVEAEIDTDDGAVVILTTEGLKNKTNYTVKANNVKSVDLVARKSTSKSFKTNIDTAAPRIDGENTVVETNQRIVLYFNEKVSKESAEDVENYSLKENKTDGEVFEILSAEWDSDDKNNVTLVTEAHTKSKSYKLTVNNIADRRKVPNVMTRSSSYTFTGVPEDKKAPQLKSQVVYSQDQILFTLDDASKIDEETALDVNNYTFKQGSNTLDIIDIEKIRSVNGEFIALITVEEMEAGKNYVLKAADVCDEFGNATKDLTIFSKTVNVGDFASAKFTGVTVDGEKAITLNFDKYLRKATAESIANYSINGDIGTPFKAEYTRNSNGTSKVELKVNALVNGKEYKVKIDGVEDLGGHLLTVSSGDDRKFTASTANKWDSDGPELQGISVLNKYVIALQFDEEVDETLLGHAYLNLTGNGGLTLYATGMNDDNTVVEFSYAGAILQDAKSYTVVSEVYGVPFKDLIGNTTKVWDDSYEINGSNNEDYVLVNSYDQVNGKTFELKMSREIVSGAGNVGDGLTAYIDKDDATIVRLVSTNKLEANKEYKPDLRVLKDIHGIAVENNDVTAASLFTASFTDTDSAKDKPYIVGVKALDRTTIEVEFSEDVKDGSGTAFTLKNIDTSKPVTLNAPKYNGETKADRNIVTIELSSGYALEGRYEYELKLALDSVVDYAGNKVAADNYVFNGIDLVQH